MLRVTDFEQLLSPKTFESLGSTVSVLNIEHPTVQARLAQLHAVLSKLKALPWIVNYHVSFSHDVLIDPANFAYISWNDTISGQRSQVRTVAVVVPIHSSNRYTVSCRVDYRTKTAEDPGFEQVHVSDIIHYIYPGYYFSIEEPESTFAVA